MPSRALIFRGQIHWHGFNLDNIKVCSAVIHMLVGVVRNEARGHLNLIAGALLALIDDFNEASCITVGLFDTDSGVKRCEHGARSAECLQRAA